MSKRRFLLLVSGGLPLAGELGACRALRDRFSIKHLPSAPLPPLGIVVHHSATPPLMQDSTDAASIDRMHKKRGMGAWYMGRTYHIAYHYVVLRNGSVEEGRPELCRGAHTRSLLHNRRLGICLVGHFDRKWQDPSYHAPPSLQMDALVSLSCRLIEKWRMKEANVLPHREIDPTECPGGNFPMEEYLSRLKAELDKGSGGNA